MRRTSVSGTKNRVAGSSEHELSAFRAILLRASAWFSLGISVLGLLGVLWSGRVFFGEGRYSQRRLLAELHELETRARSSVEEPSITRHVETRIRVLTQAVTGRVRLLVLLLLAWLGLALTILVMVDEPLAIRNGPKDGS